MVWRYDTTPVSLSNYQISLFHPTLLSSASFSTKNAKVVYKKAQDHCNSLLKTFSATKCTKKECHWAYDHSNQAKIKHQTRNSMPTHADVNEGDTNKQNNNRKRERTLQEEKRELEEM